MVELKELENGNLQIIVTDKEELQDVIDRQQDERDALFDILERTRLIGNNWGVVFEGGLTEAPIIGYGLDIDDEGNIAGCEKVWYFNNYMIESYLETLKETGSVIFTGHEDNFS